MTSAASAPDAAPSARAAPTGWRLTLRRFAKNRLAIVGVVVFATIVVAVALAGLSPYDPDRTNLRARFEGPSLSHPFGTDDLGRDTLTRVLHGGRISLLVGLLSMTFSVTLGTIVGGLAGYFRGWVDSALMRVTDLFLSMPSLFVLIVLSTLLMGTPFARAYGGTLMIVLIIGVLSWMVVARIVRSSFLTIRERDFVEAARANGAGHLRLMVRHVLPNALGPIFVQATLQVAVAIIAESGLSYLGFGIQPPTATWGNILKDAQTYMTRVPSLAIFPGLMIFLTVMSVNAIGDGLRDAFDPRRAL
ncbi:MAG: ABC transporter permease [Trueperaceae bacterium]|nr:ABC transporter permease [Trueperaceae bacterium]